MPDQTLITLLTVFVALSAIALLGQSIAMAGMFFATRRLIRQVTPLVPKIEALAESSQALLSDNRAKIAEVATHAATVSRQATELAAQTKEILALSQRQVVRFDALFDDASRRATVQMDRAELVLDDTMGRVQETVSTVHGGIMTPMKNLSGLAHGVRAAVEHFVKGPRASARRPTQDEEMFI